MHQKEFWANIQCSKAWIYEGQPALHLTNFNSGRLVLVERRRSHLFSLLFMFMRRGVVVAGAPLNEYPCTQVLRNNSTSLHRSTHG